MVVLVVLAVGLVVTAGCCLAGFRSPGSLDAYEPTAAGEPRRFRQDQHAVMEAYRHGVRRTPGMRVVEERGSVMLVDLRPTARIIDGNFGIVFRLGFEPDGTGTVVTVEGRNKVPWSLSDHGAAFRHAEAALRMNAKRHGIEEVL